MDVTFALYEDGHSRGTYFVVYPDPLTGESREQGGFTFAQALRHLHSRVAAAERQEREGRVVA